MVLTRGSNMTTPAANTLLRHSDQELRQILRQRKKSNRTSCYPCRTRKVKCDKCSPCANCAKRGYPELCSSTAQSNFETGITSGSPKSTGPHVQQPLTQTHSRVRDVYSTPAASGLVYSQSVSAQPRAGSNLPTPIGGNEGINSHVSSNNGEQDQDQRELFLGTNSMPAFLRSEVSLASSDPNTPSQTVEDAILPILGLRESGSAYPFLPAPATSLEGIKSELYQALPMDREIIRLFQCYRAEAHPFSPIVPNMEKFELELCAYLEARTLRKGSFRHQSLDTRGTEGQMSISWVGSLFAVLASGAQYSDNSLQERQAKSQLYARYSFQCLRATNFLVRPSLLCIQTLLILGNVLQNNMQPEAAWMLLGTTARMAQSLGLHDDQDNVSLPRRRLWLALVWQDCLLSLCFDRPPIATPATHDLPLDDTFSYMNAMHTLCDRTLRILSVRSHRTIPDFATILEGVAKIEDIYLGCQTTKAQPSSIRQRCESCALDLHTSFVIAWLCRPALRNRHKPESRTGFQLQLIEKCNKNLLECIRAFVKLHSLSILASRSWAVIHNGLSSALLLGLLGAAITSPEVRHLQGEILEILPIEAEGEGDGGKPRDGNIELSRPHARAVAALRRLYNDYANTSARPFAADAVGPNPVSSGNQPELAQKAVTTPLASVSSETFPSNYPDAFNFEPPDDLGLGMSPLDMFDSILFDPIDTGDFMPDYNASSSSGPWMF